MPQQTDFTEVKFQRNIKGLSASWMVNWHGSHIWTENFQTGKIITQYDKVRIQ